MTRAVSLCGAMFTISASCCIPDEKIPKDFYSNTSFIRHGGSAIVNPMGEYLSGPVYDCETILYSDIDLSYIPQKQAIHNLIGIYSRWDLFTLATQQRTYQPTISFEHLVDDTSSEGRSEVSQLEARIRILEDVMNELRQHKNEEQSFTE
jgi:hypothetical protein